MTLVKAGCQHHLLRKAVTLLHRQLNFSLVNTPKADIQQFGFRLNARLQLQSRLQVNSVQLTPEDYRLLPSVTPR